MPSCQVCNGKRIRSSKLLYPDARLRKKLSPTNLNYDFEGEVKIEVKNKKGSARRLDLRNGWMTIKSCLIRI